MWMEIKTEADIELLMTEFEKFHDSCLRDVYILTKEFVDEKLSMHFENKIIATLLFQRQFENNQTI